MILDQFGSKVDHHFRRKKAQKDAGEFQINANIRVWDNIISFDTTLVVRVFNLL
jgi:outer membrane phospholipase A